MKREWAAACVAALLISVGCAESKAPAPAASTAPAVTAAPAATTPPAATVADSEFGVPECDAFMKSWTTCVESKVPAEMRGTFKASIDQAKMSYRAAASTPQGKAGLATACTQQLTATRQALAAYNCAW
jgi:hypothetical protein